MLALVRELGFRTLDGVAHLGRLATFSINVAYATIAPPYRLRRFAEEIFNLGVLSLVIVCVSGLAVGMVLGLQGYNTLVRFGAESALGAVVGLSLIRELGPVLTALLVTGRAGSATAAEIASMVTFREHNLVTGSPLTPPMDVVMLRNVLIYFEPETRRRVLELVHRSIRVDGVLMLGAGETSAARDGMFDVEEIGRSVVLRPQAPRAALGIRPLWS